MDDRPMYEQHTIRVCTDCYFVCHGHGLPEDWSLAQREQWKVGAMEWHHHGVIAGRDHSTCTHDEDDYYECETITFATFPCEFCQSRLAGTRYYVLAYCTTADCP